MSTELFKEIITTMKDDFDLSFYNIEEINKKAGVVLGRVFSYSSSKQPLLKISFIEILYTLSQIDLKNNELNDIKKILNSKIKSEDIELIEDKIAETENNLIENEGRLEAQSLKILGQQGKIKDLKKKEEELKGVIENLKSEELELESFLEDKKKAEVGTLNFLIDKARRKALNFKKGTIERNCIQQIYNKFVDDPKKKEWENAAKFLTYLEGLGNIYIAKKIDSFFGLEKISVEPSNKPKLLAAEDRLLRDIECIEKALNGQKELFKKKMLDLDASLSPLEDQITELDLMVIAIGEKKAKIAEKDPSTSGISEEEEKQFIELLRERQIKKRKLEVEKEAISERKCSINNELKIATLSAEKEKRSIKDKIEKQRAENLSNIENLNEIGDSILRYYPKNGLIINIWKNRLKHSSSLKHIRLFFENMVKKNIQLIPEKVAGKETTVKIYISPDENYIADVKRKQLLIFIHTGAVIIKDIKLKFTKLREDLVKKKKEFEEGAYLALYDIERLNKEMEKLKSVYKVSQIFNQCEEWSKFLPEYLETLGAKFDSDDKIDDYCPSDENYEKLIKELNGLKEQAEKTIKSKEFKDLIDKISIWKDQLFNIRFMVKKKPELEKMKEAARGYMQKIEALKDGYKKIILKVTEQQFRNHPLFKIDYENYHTALGKFDVIKKFSE